MKRYGMLIIICCFALIVNGQVRDDRSIPDSIPNIPEPKPFMDGEKGWVVWPEPGYPGGFDSLFKYLNEKIIYPKKALRKKVGGNVVMTFVIEKDGSLTDIKAFRSPSIELSDECARVLQNVKFEPGTQNGKPTRVRYVMPIFFDVNNPKVHTKPPNYSPPLTPR